MSTSDAATCGESESQVWEVVELPPVATPEPAEAFDGSRPKMALQLAQELGTASNLPSAEDSSNGDGSASDSSNREPSQKKLRWSRYPVWQVGVDWTGAIPSFFC